MFYIKHKIVMFVVVVVVVVVPNGVVGIVWWLVGCGGIQHKCSWCFSLDWA